MISAYNQAMCWMKLVHNCILYKSLLTCYSPVSCHSTPVGHLADINLRLRNLATALNHFFKLWTIIVRKFVDNFGHVIELGQNPDNLSTDDTQSVECRRKCLCQFILESW